MHIRRPFLSLLALFLTATAHATQPEVPNIYNVANACYALQAGSPSSGSYVRQTGSGYAADAANLAEATAFYLKPTRLGAYLLLSDYRRDPGEAGHKELLGISDPGGEFLDQAGNFIGEAGILVAAVGDILDAPTDPVTPAGRPVRQAGENIGGVGERVAGVNMQPALALVNRANDLAVWQLGEGTVGGFQFTADVTGQKLVAMDGRLGLSRSSEADRHAEFWLRPKPGCAAYPEAELNAEILAPPRVYQATGPEHAKAPEGVGASRGRGDPEIYGFVDAHAHITAYEFIGGRVNYGSVFHKFGVDHALHDCEENHGPQGSTGLVEIATSSTSTTGHETRGWPSFNFWPRSHSLQHHQSYYKWLERAHLAGMKILVNHITHNEALCQIAPQKKNDCDGMANVRLQALRTYQIEDYIDAQAGGPGKGFFRIVTTPAQAREVIARGQMAVIIGIEMSKVLNCGEYLDQPECTREQIIERLDEVYELGARAIFPVHKFDNAFGGHLPHSGFGIGTVLTAGNLVETGHPLEVDNCPEDYAAEERDPDEIGIYEQLESQLVYLAEQGPPSKGTPFEGADPRRGTPEGGDSRAGGTDHLCNIRGLTELGEFFIQQMMQRRMIIEIDHSSSRAQSRILDITGARRYPVTSSHGWVRAKQLLHRIIAYGGTINQFARPERQGFITKVMRIKGYYDPAENPWLLEDFDYYPGSGFASDVNGIASLPPSPPPPEETGDTPIYPTFLSEDGNVRFSRQRTGDRVFEYYDDRNVDHYGLYAEHIADLSRNGGENKDETIDMFFRSAEAYLRMWERITGERK